MNASFLFLLLLLLACPLMMVFMMRGMHGGHGSADGGHAHGAGCSHDQQRGQNASLAELRQQRDELDREIAWRESEVQTAAPIGSGWR